MIIGYKYRVKDASARRHLERYARACNSVWNYCCEVQRHAMKWQRRWPTAYDLIKLCTGSSGALGIHSDAVQTVCRQFATSRNAGRKCPKFRASSGSKRALGWVPFIRKNVNVSGDHVVYLKRRYYFWHSREMVGELRAGAFSQDARGRWYISFQCKVLEQNPTGSGELGIDLGLKSVAACSNGLTIAAPHFFRVYERALATAQRAGKIKQARAIQAKIANARRHHLHEWSTKIARENRLIVVGNVNATAMAKTRLAKSVYDAGWSMFRYQLRYKASRHGARYVEVDERWTSQLCSECGALGGPKGIAQLGMREWDCAQCGASHERDVNAARNILASGTERRPPVVGVAACGEDANKLSRF